MFKLVVIPAIKGIVIVTVLGYVGVEAFSVEYWVSLITLAIVVNV